MMVTKRNCTFCGKEIEPGRGTMVVAASGSMSIYCSSKCEKNNNLGRRARKVRWTDEYRKEKAVRVKGLPATKKEAPAKEAPKEEKPVEEKKAEAPKEEKKETPKKEKAKPKKK